jgi:hypothetical protein
MITKVNVEGKTANVCYTHNTNAYAVKSDISVRVYRGSDVGAGRRMSGRDGSAVRRDNAGQVVPGCGEPQWPREPRQQQNATIVPFIEVDRGSAVDPVHDDPPDPPAGPDPPPKSLPNTAKRIKGHVAAVLGQWDGLVSRPVF